MSSSPGTSSAEPTSRIYNRERLGFYDKWVWGFSFQPWAWGPRMETVLDFYRRNLTPVHLEVGVGTGILLENADYDRFERLHLFDANPGPLQETAARMARFSPRTTRGDALLPWGLGESQFDSVACFNMIHCLPHQGGGIADKAAVFDSAAHVVKPGGMFYGTTLMQRGIRNRWRRPVAPPMMAFYNQRGWFDNRADTQEDLAAELRKRFDKVDVWVHGDVVMWQATGRD